MKHLKRTFGTELNADEAAHFSTPQCPDPFFEFLTTDCVLHWRSLTKRGKRLCDNQWKLRRREQQQQQQQQRAAAAAAAAAAYACKLQHDTNSIDRLTAQPDPPNAHCASSPMTRAH
jgi:hypothetical protein